MHEGSVNMAVEYQYPVLNKNWHLYILTIKLKSEGFNVHHINSDTQKVWLVFENPLSDLEKSRLDTFMTNPEAGLYPQSQVGYTVFTIQDLYDAWEEIEKRTGIDIKWIFPNFPDHTKLEIWIEGGLTETQERELAEAFMRLWKGKK